MTIKKKDIKKYINIIEEIRNTQINNEINIEIVDEIFNSYDRGSISLNNIKNFRNILISIQTNDNCLNCNRIAQYMIEKTNEKYCWHHCQIKQQ